MRPSIQAMLLLGFVVCASVLAVAEEGPVAKSLKIESDPPGAEVFLKQGTKEVPLGKTPLTYQAEFHSKISILRMAFKKKGFESLTQEVSASQDMVRIVLKAVALVENPNAHQDAALKRLQERLNPILLKEVPRLLEAEGSFALDIAGPLRVADLDGERTLLINLSMTDATGLPKGSGKEKQEALLRSLWTALGKTLVIPLAAALKKEKELDSLILQVFFNEQKIIFDVGVKTQTNVHMECRVTVEFQPYYGGKSMTMVQVINPCGRLEPVITTEFKADPQAKSNVGQARAQYVVPLAMLSKPAEVDTLYDRIGVLLTNAKGDRLHSHGGALAETVLATQQPISTSSKGFSESLGRRLKAAGFDLKDDPNESLVSLGKRLDAIEEVLHKSGDVETSILLYTEIADNEGQLPQQYTPLRPWATSRMGYLYLQGKLVPADFEKAAHYMRMAAEAEHKNSQYELARMYHKGLGVEKNPEQALFWLNKAAANGHEDAVKWLELFKQQK